MSINYQINQSGVCLYYNQLINLKNLILTAIISKMDYNLLYTILPKSYIKWSVTDMQKFLGFIGLSNLYHKFKQLSIDGSCLNSLTEEDLRQELEIKSTITIKKLMQFSGIKKGLQQYEQYIASRGSSQNSNSPTTQILTSMTQKPKMTKISSLKQQQIPQQILKHSSYKSVPQSFIPSQSLNPVHLIKNNSYNLPNNQSQYYNKNKSIQMENIYPRMNVNNQNISPNGHNYMDNGIIGYEIESQKMQIQGDSIISQPQQDKKKQFQLIIQQSDGPQTSFFSVKQEGAKIGRHSSNQILILDQSISRFHAQIKFEDNIFMLRDTGSTTGTFIKIMGSVEITNNMIIEMGSNQFQARLEDDSLILDIIQGPSLGYNLQISNHKRVTIGRKQTNLLNFPEDQHLSNTHATIIPMNGKFYIQDMGTTNGTWRRLSYQGEVSPLYEIMDKTVFKIGSSQTYVCTIKTTFVSQRTHPNACIICYENDKDCVYMPCKHNAACIRCSKNLKQCPICRLKIDDFVRIYKN